MDTVKTQMYTKGKCSNTGALLLRSSAIKKDQGEITIQFYEQCMVEIVNKEPKQYLQYHYDIKFAFTYNPNEIIFQLNNQKVVYKLSSESVVNDWRKVLKSKINQRGFHEQFKPIKKIGKGNFASVYLAQKLENKTSYAVKAFSKEAAYSEDKGKQCLIKEIEVMRHLDHKNCMKLHQVFESDNSLYIIFELLQGGQLYDKVKAKYKFKPHETQLIIRGILLGLREMHSKGIMHRDLKPENLLFRKQNDYDCVIADFGLAEFSYVEEYLFVRCGTPGYVAPQVLNIKDMKTKYDPICDIYSLGLIFYLLMLGHSAFPGTTYNDVLSQNRQCHIVFSEEDRKKAGNQGLDLLQKMLKKSPTQRISAEQALKHPYFNSVMELDDDKPGVVSPSKNDYPSIDSPLLTTANPKRLVGKNFKKDSCIELKVGRDNLMTGKTETVGGLESKVSGVNAIDIQKAQKRSAFCANK